MSKGMDKYFCTIYLVWQKKKMKMLLVLTNSYENIFEVVLKTRVSYTFGLRTRRVLFFSSGWRQMEFQPWSLPLLQGSQAKRKYHSWWTPSGKSLFFLYGHNLVREKCSAKSEREYFRKRLTCENENDVCRSRYRINLNYILILPLEIFKW